MKEILNRFALVTHWLGSLSGLGCVFVVSYFFMYQGFFQESDGGPLLIFWSNLWFTLFFGASLFIGFTGIGWLIRYILCGKIHFLPWKKTESRTRLFPFNLDDKFVRTSRKINPRCNPRHVKRWEWIGKEGKIFAEINAPNSKYRQNIMRGSYGGDESTIYQDLAYDIRHRWIEKV